MKDLTTTTKILLISRIEFLEKRLAEFVHIINDTKKDNELRQIWIIEKNITLNEIKEIKTLLLTK